MGRVCSRAWKSVRTTLVGSMDEIHVTPQQAIDAYQAALPGVPAYAAALPLVGGERPPGPGLLYAVIDHTTGLPVHEPPDYVTPPAGIPGTPSGEEAVENMVADLKRAGWDRVGSEAERQALVDHASEALFTEQADAVTDLHAVPFDTPQPLSPYGHTVAQVAAQSRGQTIDGFDAWLQRVAPQEMSTYPQSNAQGGLMNASQILTGIKSLYGGSDVNELTTAVQNAANADPGAAFLVLEVSGAAAKVEKAIVDAEKVVNNLRGVKLNSFQGLLTLAGGIAQVEGDLA